MGLVIFDCICNHAHCCKSKSLKIIMKYLWKITWPCNNYQRFIYGLQESCEILSVFSLVIIDNDSKTSSSISAVSVPIPGNYHQIMLWPVCNEQT